MISPSNVPYAKASSCLGEASSSDELTVVRLRSIYKVAEAHWDSINGERDVLHTHRFIRSVEDARVENGAFWYLLFYRHDELVATAALSAFTVSLDLFIEGILGRFVKSIRRWLPRFLKIRILFCGLPISLGQRNLVIGDPLKSAAVLALLAREMSEICHAHQIRFMCVKEFRESDIPSMDGLIDHGFFRGHSIPYVSVDIQWPSFEAYLSALRHNYRRPIKLTLGRRGQSRPEIEVGPADRPSGEMPRLIVGGARVCSPQAFFDLYLQVMDRAKVKLETLNRAFFEHLYANMDVNVLAMVKGNRILGTAILIVSGTTMTFLLVGLDYAQRDQYEVYFNLIYGIISLAIEWGCTKLELGQTSYWLKQRIGGVCSPEYLYFRANRRFTHILLHSLRSVIFPETALPAPRVFRAEQEYT